MCIIKLVVSKVYTIDSALLKKTAITAKTQLVDFYLLNGRNTYRGGNCPPCPPMKYAYEVLSKF